MIQRGGNAKGVGHTDTWRRFLEEEENTDPPSNSGKRWRRAPEGLWRGQGFERRFFVSSRTQLATADPTLPPGNRGQRQGTGRVQRTRNTSRDPCAWIDIVTRHCFWWRPEAIGRVGGGDCRCAVPAPLGHHFGSRCVEGRMKSLRPLISSDRGQASF